MFSTMSFSVDKHFCGTMLMDVAIFSSSKACGSATKICAKEMTSVMDSLGDSCCTNKKLTVEGQDELKISFNSLDLDQQVFLQTLVFTYIYIFEDLSLKKIPYEHYSPPLLITDIQILDQVFLI